MLRRRCRLLMRYRTRTTNKLSTQSNFHHILDSTIGIKCMEVVESSKWSKLGWVTYSISLVVHLSLCHDRPLASCQYCFVIYFSFLFSLSLFCILSQYNTSLTLTHPTPNNFACKKISQFISSDQFFQSQYKMLNDNIRFYNCFFLDIVYYFHVGILCIFML